MLFDQYKNKTKMIVLKMHLHGGKKNENYNVLKKVSTENTKPIILRKRLEIVPLILKIIRKKNHFISIKTICFDFKKTIFKGKLMHSY